MEYVIITKRRVLILIFGCLGLYCRQTEKKKFWNPRLYIILPYVLQGRLFQLFACRF